MKLRGWRTKRGGTTREESPNCVCYWLIMARLVDEQNNAAKLEQPVKAIKIIFIAAQT